MKTSVSSYSFSYLMNTCGETQLSIIQKAKDIGFDAIEFTDLMPPEGVTEAEYAEMIRKETERVGIAISGYSVAADLLSGSGGDLDAEVERIKKKVDIAAILGAPVMRHDASFSFDGDRSFRGFLNVVDRLADGCRRVTEYAETKGIRTTIENHGFFCQDSDRVEALVNTVAHKNFGIQLDIGNFLCVDEDPTLAVGRCAPYAFNVHIKDFIFKRGEEGVPGEGFIHTRAGNFIRGTIIGHGVVPIRQCVGAIRRVGYDGYLTLEFEGLEICDFALRAGCAYLKQFC